MKVGDVGGIPSRTLGKTGLRVSEVGFGAWAIGGNEFGNSYGPTDDSTSIAAVRRAAELGCTFFDTADVYGWGHSERILGEALKETRKEVYLATKVGGDFYHGGVRMNFSPDYIRFALDKSLERLGTDYLDLYQLHNPPGELIGDPKLYDVLEELKGENKIHHYGLSIHAPWEGELAMEVGKPETLQLPFSLLRQEWLDKILSLARHTNTGVIAREPLANGFLTGKFTGEETFPPGDIRSRWPRGMIRGRAQAAKSLASLLGGSIETLAQDALRFVLSFESVSTAIPGIKSPAQAEADLGAAGKTLTEGQLKQCREWNLSNAGA